MPERYEKLDGFRGVTMLSMAAYHTLWDLNYMYGTKMHWYQTMPGFLWERSICMSFILLSGFFRYLVVCLVILQAWLYLTNYVNR